MYKNDPGSFLIAKRCPRCRIFDDYEELDYARTGTKATKTVSETRIVKFGSDSGFFLSFLRPHVRPVFFIAKGSASAPI